MSTVTNNKTLEEESQEVIENIDFKMVTFSLAGKDYGIDIMKVKEIAKDNEFTYVPNTASYVRGVYNLRGDIISVIDLRLMFNLPAEQKSGEGLENMIILRLDDHIIGVIVDSTDKVIGINSETIQPTHPLFGDINVKYISGVVENDGRLYIILDVERIFGKEEAAEPSETEPEEKAETGPEEPLQPVGMARPPQQLDLNFIAETLATFRHFHVSPLNSDWVHQRYAEWEQQRNLDGRPVQLTSPEDADQFLDRFYSKETGRLFSDGYMKKLQEIIPEFGGGTVSAWNPGCGKGFEAISLACALKNRFPDKNIKIWAHDSDLLSVSSAAGLFFNENEIPETMKRFTQETKNGIQFIPEIKESIMFEYHDVTNANSFPMVDMILSRDVLSFLDEEKMNRVLVDFDEKLKPGGIVIVGDNERLDPSIWREMEIDPMVAFKKE